MAILPRPWFICDGPFQGRTVCLTFDDGPHPQYTPRVLDVLKEQGVAATFFLIGQKADRYPELVRRIVAEGHVVGNHTYYHSNPPQTSASQLIEEIHRTRQVLEELTGSSCSLFRPPMGKLTAVKLLRVWLAGQTVALWNVDPKDCSSHSSAEIGAFFACRPLRAGDLVLLHDNHAYVAPVLPELIETARQSGLSFVTLPQWLRASGSLHLQPV